MALDLPSRKSFRFHLLIFLLIWVFNKVQVVYVLVQPIITEHQLKTTKKGKLLILFELKLRFRTLQEYVSKRKS